MNFDISARIRELRIEKGLSTNKLSTLAGLSQSYVRKLESGENKPTVESLDLLCQALGITFEDFVSYKLNDSQLDGFCKLMGCQDNTKS